jgi:hypothetical protein
VSADAPPPDRATILAAVMPALLEARPEGGGDEVGAGRIVAVTSGVLAGLPVARETFGRLGVRTRPTAVEGRRLVAAEPVVDVGGPVAAIRVAAPVAIAFLERLSAIASGVREPDLDDALEIYAARLSARGPVRDDGPTFRLELEGSP